MFGFGNRSTMTRGKISDPHWAVISLFLPAERGRGCRPAHDNRRFFDGMMWILRTGSPWRDLPEEFGNWNSIYQRFRRWCQAGVFDALLEALVELGITDDWTTQMVDSTSVRGHSQAAGAKRGVLIKDLVEAAAAIRARSTSVPTVSDVPSPSPSPADKPPTASTCKA